MTPKTIKICIACGSTNITIPPAGLDFKMSAPDYCQECHVKGNFPLISIDEVAEYKKGLKEHKRT